MDICDIAPSKIDKIDLLDYEIEISGHRLLDESLRWSLRCANEYLKIEDLSDSSFMPLLSELSSIFTGSRTTVECLETGQVALVCMLEGIKQRLIFSTDVVAFTWRQVDENRREDVQIYTFP